MFERYTEAARRALFFARYEASELGAMAIETEHILLGLVRDARVLAMLPSLPLERLRAEIDGRAVAREKVPTSMEIPFTADTMRVLQFAAQEADDLRHAHIGVEHLLLGLLREEHSIAGSALAAHGVRLGDVRAEVARLPAVQAGSPQALAWLQIDGITRLLEEELSPRIEHDPEAVLVVVRIRSALEQLRGSLGG